MDRSSSAENGIRTVGTKDVPRIREILSSTGNFTEEELKTAIELVEETIHKGEASGYIVAVLASERKIEGYVCYGPTPLTDGVYDLYWIAVDSNSQGKGFGRRLLEYVEKDVRKRGGRMIVIETSSQEKYTPTIRFYESRHYERAARLKNFYKVGDDKLIYLKELKEDVPYQTLG